MRLKVSALQKHGPSFRFDLAVWLTSNVLFRAGPEFFLFLAVRAVKGIVEAIQDGSTGAAKRRLVNVANLATLAAEQSVPIPPGRVQAQLSNLNSLLFRVQF
jgi:hypothetical protein